MDRHFYVFYLHFLQESVEIKKMATALERLIDKRFGWMFDVLDEKFDPVYLMAAAFDPNTVHLLSKDELDLAITSVMPFVSIFEFSCIFYYKD